MHTDEAFTRLPDETLETMFKEIPQLRAVLTQYIVPGVITMIDAWHEVNPKTLSGQTLFFASANGLTVNNAWITTADVATDKGMLPSLLIDDVAVENPELND